MKRELDPRYVQLIWFNFISVYYIWRGQLGVEFQNLHISNLKFHKGSYGLVMFYSRICLVYLSWNMQRWNLDDHNNYDPSIVYEINRIIHELYTLHALHEELQRKPFTDLDDVTKLMDEFIARRTYLDLAEMARSGRWTENCDAALIQWVNDHCKTNSITHKQLRHLYIKYGKVFTMQYLSRRTYVLGFPYKP